MFSQTEKEALRALFRCARYRRVADVAALSLRVNGSTQELAQAIESFRARGLVETGTGSVAIRLTMAGLAVAVALLPPARRTRRPILRVVRAA